MRAFTCPHCAQLVFFHNSGCLRCGAELGFDPSRMTVVLMEPGANRCVNFELAGCNWTAEPSGDGRCASCELTRTRPADGDSDALFAFADAERQKRWLVHQLLDIGLPVQPYSEASGTGLAFDLLSSRIDQVMIGHDDGLITLDLAEADDSHREQVRLELGEAYRTVLGHFRHEIGHYYWDVLIDGDENRVAEFRELFGDETYDYSEALEVHYRQGPPLDWAERYVSRYATMHPWEDWAETFAHYLHLRDGLQTAASFGLQVNGPAVARDQRDELSATPSEPQDTDSLAGLVAEWLALSYALNAMSRSLGSPDLYPFVLTKVVIDKLRFVHAVVAASSR